MYIYIYMYIYICIYIPVFLSIFLGISTRLAFNKSEVKLNRIFCNFDGTIFAISGSCIHSTSFNGRTSVSVGNDVFVNHKDDYMCMYVYTYVFICIHIYTYVYIIHTYLYKYKHTCGGGGTIDVTPGRCIFFRFFR
jgi:hypothetical protein